MTIAVFLDRDGTINVEKGYMCKLDEVELVEGAAQAIRKLNDAGILAILTTNQTGAARGYYDEAHIVALNNRVAELLQQQADARLDAVFYCPHLAEGVVERYALACQCRKPETGMIDQACQQFPQIDRARSYVLGDKASDVAFGYAAGARPILLKTGYGEQVLAGKYQSLDREPEAVCDNLPQAIELILSQVALQGTR